jgi:ribonucleoside-diphosphate reductase beta chain
LIIENLALFAPFYIISWFNRCKEVLKDTNKQVMYTSREETIHSEVGIRSFLEIKKDHPELFDDELETKILKEAKDSVEHEFDIITWSLNGFEGEGDDGEGLSANILKEFLKNRLNNSLEKIGYSKIFTIDNELLEKTKWFDKQLIAPIRTDFFQERPSEYGVGSTGFEEEDLF